MAEDDNGFVTNEDFIAWLIGVLLLLAIISSILSALSSLGFDPTDPSGSVEKLRAHFSASPLTDETPLGTPIKTIRDIDVWSSAQAFGNLLGIQPEGALGVLVGGPEFVDGFRWWDIDFEENPDGWVQDTHLRIQETPAQFILRVLITSWKRFAVIASFLALIGLVYSVIRINQIRKEEIQKLGIPTIADFTPSQPEASNEKWDRVIELVNGASPNDWRQAIIEADIMLDELVEKMGYTTGETLGERMKSIEPSDFVTLNQAWEAHKVRNKIAHEGGDFILTQREARRIVALFEEVFNEFRII